MTLAIAQSISAVTANVPVSFYAFGGDEPYTYSVLPDGAGGTINPVTGAYVAPSRVGSTPRQMYDIIQVVDANGGEAIARLIVGSPLLLVCDIIEKELELASGRVYLWDQKIMQPTDSGLYVAVSVPICKPFANVIRIIDGQEHQALNMMATLDIDIISRGPDARDRKEEVPLALKSTYAQRQMEANSFHIASISKNFLNISQVDGAAIPYRYKITVNMQYLYRKPKKDIPYFDTFSEPILFFDNYDSRDGVGIRTDYSERPVGTSDWFVLVPYIKRNVRALSVFDSSGQTMEIGTCNYNAPPNSEVSQMLVNPGGLDDIEIDIEFNQRISIRAVSGPATSGENDLNIFF